MPRSDGIPVQKQSRPSFQLKQTAGWREWISLPDLGIRQLKAKLDTGARTSALHAWDITPVTIAGEPHIRFSAHPFQHDDEQVVECLAKTIGQRWVTNSGGGRERRYVIVTTLAIAEARWPIELTLTNRDEMGFRFLLGREAMRGRLIVDPNRSYVIGKRKVRKKVKRKRQSGTTLRTAARKDKRIEI